MLVKPVRILLSISFIIAFFGSTIGINPIDSLKAPVSQPKVKVEFKNKIYASDSSLEHTTLLDPEEDLFTPSFFAINSGLYKFPVLLNTDDYGWVSKNIMLTFDTIGYSNDTTPLLNAKYDYGYTTTHWFSADFKRKIGKSKLSAKFNRNASEPLYNNTRSARNNFALGTELPFTPFYKMTLNYFRNQASISENGGILNVDSIPKVEEFNETTLFSNLNTAQNNIFTQNANILQEFRIASWEDSITGNKSYFNLHFNTSFDRNKYDFSLSEEDIDSGYFANNFIDTIATFDSVGFEKVAIQPSISFGQENGTTNFKVEIGAKKEWHNYALLNNSFAFVNGKAKLGDTRLGLNAQYHFESFWNENFIINGYSDWKISSKKSDTTIYHSQLRISAGYSQELPTYFFLSYSGNHNQWNNSFTPVQRLIINSTYNLAKWNSLIDVELQNIGDYIYLNEASSPQQATGNISTAKFHFKNIIGYGFLKLKTGLIYQYSSSNLIRIPNFITRSTLSFNFKLRSVPFATGGTFNYFSKYTGLNYNPAIRHFHLGNQTVGGTPVVDWFLSARIGPADLYFKYDNSFYFFNRNLFLGDNYPIYKSYIRFGLKWRLKN